MKAHPYIQNKRDNISQAIQETITVKELTPYTNINKKLNCEKVFSQPKRTSSQIFLKDFAHFKNVCFNNTSVSDQFKTKIGNYKTNSFLSSFSILKYLYVLSLNFIAKEQFISQKAYATEGLPLTRPLAFDNKA